MIVSWAAFKNFLDTTKLYNFLNYMEHPDSYYVWLSYQDEMFSLTLDKATVDCEDFVNNYKSKAIIKNDIANDGQTYSKVTHVLTGRYLRDEFVKIRTSTKQNNDETGHYTVRLYDVNDHETDVSANVVKTAIDFLPNFTYEIYGGGVETIDTLTSEVYISSVICPDIPQACMYYIRNKMILQPKENVFVSGIGTAEIKYNPQMPLASKLRIFLKHAAGEQHNYQIELQYYK